MEKKTLNDLWKRQEELNRLIISYEFELREVESQIAEITGTANTNYDRVYDDENPSYIQNTEDGI